MVDFIEVVVAETLTCLTYFRWSPKTEVGRRGKTDKASISSVWRRLALSKAATCNKLCTSAGIASFLSLDKTTEQVRTVDCPSKGG
jgi:hypothetical protein